MSGIWAQYARYNRLANEKLYAACAGLSGAEYRRDLGAFFGSVHGTLTHLLLGDRIWMARSITRAAIDGTTILAAKWAMASTSCSAIKRATRALSPKSPTTRVA